MAEDNIREEHVHGYKIKYDKNDIYHDGIAELIRYWENHLSRDEVKAILTGASKSSVKKCPLEDRRGHNLTLVYEGSDEYLLRKKGSH